MTFWKSLQGHCVSRSLFLSWEELTLKPDAGCRHINVNDERMFNIIQQTQNKLNYPNFYKSNLNLCTVYNTKAGESMNRPNIVPIFIRYR